MPQSGKVCREKHTCRAALGAPPVAQDRAVLKVTIVVGQERGSRPAEPRGAGGRGWASAGPGAAATAAAVAAALLPIAVALHQGDGWRAPAAGGVPAHRQCHACLV
jgi:hypothetical protein